MCSATPEKHKMYSEVLGPAYLTLVDLLMTKSMITLNQSDWSSEDKETFRCYRQVDIIHSILANSFNLNIWDYPNRFKLKLLILIKTKFIKIVH